MECRGWIAARYGPFTSRHRDAFNAMRLLENDVGALGVLKKAIQPERH
jgi:hypothetical protein